MSIDYIQVRQQVQLLGDQALLKAGLFEERRQQAWQALENNAHNQERLRRKIETAFSHDPYLRCAKPNQLDETSREALDAHFPPPPLPPFATILAADGSQINPSRHEAIQYCLVNVGAFEMKMGSGQAPQVSVQTSLMYDDQLYTESGMITEARIALLRDVYERKRLAELARLADPPVITFTDGPMELWGAKEADNDFKQSLKHYLETLSTLRDLGVITAGYVDKPAADLVVRMLEIALMDENQLLQGSRERASPLRGLIDRDLFYTLLAPGERSAVFAIQSRSVNDYQETLGLHFFYLNAGRADHPSLARVEIPAWVAQDSQKVGTLHTILLQQCRIMGTHPYPYALHRSHETAVVSMQEKEKVTEMISLELRRRGIPVGETSNKQFAKDRPGRTRLERL